MNGWGKYLLHIEHDIWNYNPLLCSKHRPIHLMDYYSTWHYSASFPSSLAKYWKLSEKACQIHRHSWPWGCKLIDSGRQRLPHDPHAANYSGNQRVSKGDRQHKQWLPACGASNPRQTEVGPALSPAPCFIYKRKLISYLPGEDEVPQGFYGPQEHFLICSKVEFDLSKNDSRVTLTRSHSDLSAACWLLELKGMWETLV